MTAGTERCSGCGEVVSPLQDTRYGSLCGLCEAVCTSKSDTPFSFLEELSPRERWIARLFGEERDRIRRLESMWKQEQGLRHEHESTIKAFEVGAQCGDPSESGHLALVRLAGRLDGQLRTANAMYIDQVRKADESQAELRRKTAELEQTQSCLRELVQAASMMELTANDVVAALLENDQDETARELNERNSTLGKAIPTRAI